MKKLSFLIILIISGFLCSAQLQVKEGSFKKVEGFVNINTEKMFDDNDRPYAVLKIKTENINDKQRRELGFGGDAQTFFETEYKDGEVWLYISYYATFLKISHPDLSSTEFWFPYDMEPKRGYELTLVNKPAVDEELVNRIERLETLTTAAAANPDDFGYIVVKTGSLEGATVYIDGKEMEMKTPFVSDPIKKGPHRIKVVKDGYEDYQDIVAVDSKGMKTVNVDLKKCKSINI
ncbi:MAG: PEGA domain-containing protein, partial [Bacteroidales bacterium]|nr:PEGA domain-containing protein [Bacteroidales bacterium]